MGTATYVPVVKFPIVMGNKLISYGTLTMAASYATGGDSIDWAAETGIGAVEVVSINGSIGGYMLTPDAANAKILAYEAGADAAALDEVASTTNLSSETAQVIVVGNV